ncbi:MAG: AtpZ/AtpI family protein [Myxococcales bacterium]|nr:AtpZ/AtpI family protein [Myxococcales bacterium]
MNRKTDRSSSEPRSANRRMGRAYQASFEAVIAVAVGGAAGGWADQRFGTAPFLLLTGVILGFGTFVLRLVRLMKELAPPPHDPRGVAKAENEDRTGDHE